MTKHTPTPWDVDDGDNVSIFELDTFDFIAEASWSDKRRSQAEANAAFIVRAVNSHYQLLEACKRALSMPDGTLTPDILANAIAKAEGGSND